MSLLQFEIVNADGSLSSVKVFDIFVHHYTRETMRYLRIESLKPYSVHGTAEYIVVNEEEFEELLKRRKFDDKT